MDALILILSIAAGLIILTILVVIHELGHAIAAKRNGVKVEEFGIGFPPRAWSKTVPKSILGEKVTYSINWLPLGGFVKLQGEHDTDTKKGDYGAATFWQKTKILLAGVAMNWLAAAVLFTVLAFIGVPKIVDNQFNIASDNTIERQPVQLAYIEEGSPAAKAGLKVGDEVNHIAGRAITTVESMQQATREFNGQTVTVDFTRGGSSQSAEVALRSDETKKENEGYLGASLNQRESYRATWSAPVVGVGLTVQLTGLTFQGLGDTVVNLASGIAGKLTGNATQADVNLEKAGQGVAGPVGLLGVILPQLIKAGFDYVLLVMAIISLSLAALNVLPIPALDGGRWFMTAIARLFKRPLSPEKEELINGIGFMFLMALFVIITIADVGKILR